MKADPKPSGPRKLNYTGAFGWQQGIAEQKKEKVQKTSKGISPACVLPTAAPVPAPAVKKEEPAPAVKKEEPAPAVKKEEAAPAAKKEEPHGLGLTWESF